MNESMIKKIQGLMDKANATEFGPERDVFLAKADDLMLKYRVSQEEVNQARLAAGEGIIEKVVKYQFTICHEGDPFMDEFTNLAATLARANGCTILINTGWKGYGDAMPRRATLYGYEIEAKYVEMLFMTLQLQLAGEMEPKPSEAKTYAENVYALHEAGVTWKRMSELLAGYEKPASQQKRVYRAHCDAIGEPWQVVINPRTYQRSMITGFNRRIAERLAAQKKESDADGTAVVLYDRNKRVADFYAEETAGQKLGTLSVRQKSMNYAGAARGRAAADKANLSRSAGSVNSNARKGIS